MNWTGDRTRDLSSVLDSWLLSQLSPGLCESRRRSFSSVIGFGCSVSEVEKRASRKEASLSLRTSSIPL